jgi:hypothetical protein
MCENSKHSNLIAALNCFGVSDEKAKLIADVLIDQSERKFFKLSVSTPFTESELEEYSVLTGKSLPEIEKTMELYTNYGIGSLHQINILIKLGHYCG